MHRPWKFNEFTVLWVFAAVVLALLAFGAAYAWRQVATADVAATNDSAAPAVVTTAPTQTEYRTETAEVMTPFLEQAMNVTPEHLAAKDDLLLDLVTKTQDRMMRVTVPKDDRDAHLAFVLLLEQWKRALNGSKPDQSAVLAATKALVAQEPWALRR